MQAVNYSHHYIKQPITIAIIITVKENQLLNYDYIYIKLNPMTDLWHLYIFLPHENDLMTI